MVICVKPMYTLHMSRWSNVLIVYSWNVNECVQKPNALVDECAVTPVRNGWENQCSNGHNWRKCLVVDAYYVHNSCSINLLSIWGFIMSLLTTEGRKSYEFSLNFTWYRPGMIISIVCKRQTHKIKRHLQKWHFGILLFTGFLPDGYM